MRQNKQGFTLPEVTLAMAMAAVIGLAIVGVSTALSSAYLHSQTFYQCLQTSRGAMARIQSAIRKAQLVTYLSPTTLALWQEDLDGDGRINPLETRIIAYDSAAREVRLYWQEFPQNLGEAALAALNQTMTLSAATSTSTVNGALDSAYQRHVVLARDVRDFRVSASIDPPLTQVVRVSLKVAEDSRSVTLRSAVCLRAGKTAYVGVSGNEYYLSDVKIP